MRGTAGGGAIAACLLVVAAARGESESPEAHPYARTQLSTDVLGRLGPPGGLLKVELNHQRGRRKSPMDFPESYVQTGGALGINTSLALASVHAEWQPAAFFTLRATGRMFNHFGSLYTLYTFDQPDATYSDADLDAYPGALIGGLQQEAELKATFRALIGRVFLSNTTTAAYVHFSAQRPYFLDFTRDMLLARTDFVLTNLLLGQYLFWRGDAGGSLGAGAFWDYTFVAETNDERHRIGPALSYRSNVDDWGQLRGFLGVGVNAVDRNRAGDFTLLVGAGWDWTP